jgi:glycogen operon protein
LNRNLPTQRLEMTLTELLRRQPFQWHGVKLNSPDRDHESHSLTAAVRLLGYPLVLHIIVNAYWEALEFEIPPLDEAQESWRRFVDTYLDPPDDIRGWADVPQCARLDLPCSAALVMLLAKAGPDEVADAVDAVD